MTDILPPSQSTLAHGEPGSTAGEQILQVNGLSVDFMTDEGNLPAVDNVSFELKKGRTLGIVGESGCGKSTLALALLGLVPPPGKVHGGAITLDGQNLLELSGRQWQEIRGRRIAMIFQEPLTAMNPVFTVGDQIAEAFQIHQQAPRKQALQRATDALARVGIPDAATRAQAYPHQLSGGMRQRAMIAMALACRPDILIADEATTALDVTIQAQILDLLLELQESEGMAILFISHNLGVVSEIADDILVMYAGQIVERSPAMALFAEPRHPYTQGLLSTLPRPETRGQLLAVIPGTVPDLRTPTPGCRFADRCPIAEPICRNTAPILPDGIHAASCHMVTA